MKTTIGNCIMHCGFRDVDGYGQVKKNGKTKRAHRVAWETANQASLLRGSVIMHVCDNPGCINPDHLKLGSHKENYLDKMSKGRGVAKGGKSISEHVCPNGHEKTKINTYVSRNGSKSCMICRRKRTEESNMRRKLK